MQERELFSEVVGICKFMQFLAERLPSDEYRVIARLEEGYLEALLNEHALHLAIQELDQQ